MAFVDIHDISIHYHVHGELSSGRPIAVLSNSLGTTMNLWDSQIAALGLTHTVLRYDQRGHGLSGVSAIGFGVDQLGRDVLGLMDHLSIRQAAFCGISLGGMTGMWLGTNAPERFTRLALCNTAARIPPPESWDARIAAVAAGGMASMTELVLERWFTAGFRQSDPVAVQAVREQLLTTPAPGYAACCAAIRDMDQRETIRAIELPTLVISGTFDPSTPPADGQAIAAAIPGSHYVELAAAHLSNIETRDGFNTALCEFLNARDTA